MNALDYEKLREWLATVQGYSVTPATAQRMSAVLSAALRTQAAVTADSLFWTEPSNLYTTLSACARSEGDSDG